MAATILGLVALCCVGDLPSVQEMATSRQDVWGEEAVHQPGGPSYEFFKDLLPPLRYVNTAFRHYPIVLSAPLAPVKARWVSNGSAVNARADKRPMRSEEHTSELQSLTNLVCRLLLEKKKIKTPQT